jgi:hypothetical protein
VISEKLDAANRESSSKLGKLDDGLDILEERVTAVALCSADNQNNSSTVVQQQNGNRWISTFCWQVWK